MEASICDELSNFERVCSSELTHRFFRIYGSYADWHANYLLWSHLLDEFEKVAGVHASEIERRFCRYFASLLISAGEWLHIVALELGSGNEAESLRLELDAGLRKLVSMINC